jgi:uncharacterized protein YjbI with pentapeptide repeats
MANKEHLTKLHEGVEAWNAWRNGNPAILPDLRGADLREINPGTSSFRNIKVEFHPQRIDPGAKIYDLQIKGVFMSLENVSLDGSNLAGVDLNGADLSKAMMNGAFMFGANLSKAKLYNAQLRNTNLGAANIRGADLSFALLDNAFLSGADVSDSNLSHAYMNWAKLKNTNLSGAKLKSANLAGVDLSGADLSFADLSGAFLEGAMLIETNFTKAVLSRCSIFGVSGWDLKLDDTMQEGLIATPHNQPVVTVDGLEVAQFIYLLLNNKKLTQVINTMGEKGVLILGRFTPERKVILDTIRERLRERGFLPMMFDFEKPRQKDFTETIKVLAGMNRFIIADITNPKSSPLELQATVPDYMTPLVPIIHEDEKPFSMFLDLQQKYDWVLDVLEYDSIENLGNYFDEAIIEPALVMADRLLMKKTQTIRTRHLDEYKRKS